MSFPEGTSEETAPVTGAVLPPAAGVASAASSPDMTRTSSASRSCSPAVSGFGSLIPDTTKNNAT